MMRKDVNKILTECYKENNRSASRYPRRQIDRLFDETGGKMGIQKIHTRASRHWMKSFGENLNYLPRFLEKNVGRKWDDIYSEISQVFDRRSTVNAHIFQHLFDYFTPAKDLLKIDGEYYLIQYYYRAQESLADSHNGSCRMYVDPEDGILKKNEHWKSYSQAREEKAKQAKLEHLKSHIVLSKTQELHKRDGLWYVFELKPLPEPIISYEFDEDFPYDYEARLEWLERKRNFDSLPVEEKAKVGKKRIRRFDSERFDKYVDSDFHSRLTKLQRVLVKRGKHQVWKDIPATHYYASMRSPSKKELRAFGLI